jgi:Family of unknown function (DUF6152)
MELCLLLFRQHTQRIVDSVMRTLFGTMLVTALGSTLLYAHHSYGAYFEDQTVSIEGTVESIRFANPHVTFSLRTDAGEVYTAEWQNLIQLRHGNVGPTTLKAGDRVIVIASPPRDPASHKITLLREVRRPADGWLWRRTTRQ